MITKQRLSDNASLGDISANSVCDVALATASSDGSSSDASGSKTASQEALKSDSYGRRLLPDDERKVIPGLLALEDSCNAVDNALRPELKDDEDSIESDLSFNGKINNLKDDKTVATVAANDSGVVMTIPVRKAPKCELIDATKGFERADTRKEAIERARQERLNKSAELLAKENSSWMHYNNEKSPDLFADEDDEEEEYFGRPNGDDSEPDEVDEGVEVRRQARSQKLRHSSGVGLPDNEQPDDKGDRIDHVERVWLKRLQLSLSGVPPPPSLTFSNMEIDQLLTIYGERTQQTTKPDCLTPVKGADKLKQTDAKWQTNLGPECLSRPTHSTEALSSTGWPDLLRCRAHGLHYNKSTVTEKLELLGLKYVERYIGAETSSSFNMTHSPSSAKKRNQRMKMLNQSPGSRLSHLARRRAIFSSANLLNTNKATGSASGVANNSTGGNSSKVQILSRLNPFRLCNRQVLLDPKKSDNRRKSKIKTPKRRTPVGVKASPRRRTPGSSAKKRSTIAMATCSQPLHVPATRESSKRALFLSPQNGDHGSGGTAAVVSASRFDSRPVSSSKQQLDRVIFSEARIMRSKRTLLFSPQKGDENRTIPSAAASLKRARSPEGNDGDSRYHRHSDTGERTEKIRRTEGSGLTEDDLTPRSLKFARSKSFCVGAQASNDASSQPLPECNGKSLFRANSAITSEDGNRPVMVLTENHKKKLLWAVSQALQSKQITVKHELFKQHASNLVRVVKKLFLEFNDNSINSTSEKLLRLANKHVFEVIQGKSVDDIYFREKTRILNARNRTKLQGYIGPDEYEMRQLKRTGSLASSLDAPSLDCSASQNFLSQTSVFSQTSSVFDLSQQSDSGSVRGGMRPAASTGNLSTAAEGPPIGSTTVLRENIISELRQRSSQKQVSFSGKDPKCPIPYAATDKVPPNNKLLVGGSGGGGALTSSILKAKRQILFE